MKQNSFEELLRYRELIGLRFTLIFSILAVIIASFAFISTFQSELELILTFMLITAALIFLVIGLILNIKGKNPPLIGWMPVFIYAIVNLSLLYIWYISVGGEKIPYSFFLKAAILPISFLTLIMVSLPGRPLYTLVYTLLLCLGYGVYFGIALSDPRTQLTDSILDATSSTRAHLGLSINNIMTILISGLLLSFLLYRFRRTTKDASRAEHAESQLSRYFSPNIVSQLADSGTNPLVPTFNKAEVTILFSDIRDFTAISEKQTPEQTFELLKLYHETMVESIFTHGGTLDKFIGDGIMASFGTPRPKPDDALRAVKVGIDMLRRLINLNKVLLDRGLPELKIGIGIHCGPALIGNIGTQARLEYTVIGDTVNTASRIESLCKVSGDMMLISESVKQKIDGGNFTLMNRGLMKLKGKTSEIRVYGVDVI